MLSGAVLSGGMSSRMGEDKGLLRLGNVPLAKRVAATLAEVADQVVVAVAPGMSRQYAKALGPRIVVVEDESEAQGPVQGLITALSAAGGEYVLVSPCDTPFLKVAVCRAIAENASGRDGAVPKILGKFEPLHAAYRRETTLAAFRKLEAEGRHKPIEAYPMLDLAFLSEEVLAIIDPLLESFWNLNTPIDLKKAEKKLRALRSR